MTSYFTNQNIYLKINLLSKLPKVIVYVQVVSKSAFERFAHKDAASRKTEFFVYVISRERRANRPKQLWNDAFHVKTSQSVKN